MRKLIPFLNNPIAPLKPTVQKRLDTVFTSLMLMLQLTSANFASALTAYLTRTFSRIHTMLYADIEQLAFNLKLNRTFWVNYLRAGEDAARIAAAEYVNNAKTAEGKPMAGSVKPDFLYELVALREQYASNTSKEVLQLFDSIVFAFFSMDRVLTWTSTPNYSTITNAPATPPEGSVDPITNIPQCLAELNITPEEFSAEYRRRAKAQKHIIMSTAGVNGPATWTAHSDAKALIGNSELYIAFQNLAEISGMKRFTSDLLGTVSLPSYDTTNDYMLNLGRLHSFEEWGGKVRTVAIVDYWTQLILTPLHDTIFHFLGKLEQDGTFNQDAMAERVRSWTAQDGISIYSYDLTAATDRLPMELQERVLSVLLGPSFAASWRTLLVNRDYVTADGKSLRYACGQPMGAKSSWAMLALTHHIIVQAAAYPTGTTNYNEYALLGDDITLTGSTIADSYRSIMDYYGVGINLFKSIVPIPGALPSAEICKRVFINGVELSVFPVKLIAKTVMNGRLLPQLQNHVTARLINPGEHKLLDWFAGLVDGESYTFNFILNRLPKSITGLLHRLSNDFTKEELNSYYPNANVTISDITSAFSYTAIVEQLKRLDSLLRQAQFITAAIEQNAFGYHTQQINNLGWQYTDPDHNVKELAASMPKFNATHPIVRAAVDEMDRIGDLLFKLRSGDRDASRQARTRLLDMFRSSLVDAWSDTSAARGQAERSLIQRSLTSLTDIALHRLEQRDNQKRVISPGHTLSFTVMLAYLNRLWTVDWRLGGTVNINSVRSRVVSSGVTATKISTELGSKVHLSSMFAVPNKKLPDSGKPAVSAIKRQNPHVMASDGDVVPM